MLAKFDKKKVIKAADKGAMHHAETIGPLKGVEREMAMRKVGLCQVMRDAAKASTGDTVTLAHSEFGMIAAFWS